MNVEQIVQQVLDISERIQKIDAAIIVLRTPQRDHPRLAKHLENKRAALVADLRTLENTWT